MARQRNLMANQWAQVLLNGSTPATVASALRNGEVLPWMHTILRLTADSVTTLDLGSGRGDHSAVLALHGKKPTLLDWSKENVDFSARLFDIMGLSGQSFQGDITKPLPFEANAFDTVFSCGVFEYFPRETMESILREAFRVASKRVIIMVPNALSIPYRIGKWYMERSGLWPWGGEVPSYTLRPHFRHVGAARITEFTVATKHSLDFLTPLPMGETLRRVSTKLFKLRDHSEPSRLRQGYLLITVGEKR